jgi:hypothetical protein
MNDVKSVNPLVWAGTVLLITAMLCSTFLVYSGEVAGALYMTAVMSPIVAGVIGAVSAIKGFQSGSAATADATKAAAEVASNGK